MWAKKYKYLFFVQVRGGICKRYKRSRHRAKQSPREQKPWIILKSFWIGAMCGDKSTPNLFRTFKMRKNILCSSLRLLGFAVQCAQDSLYAKALRCPVYIRQLMCKSISTRSRNGGTQESDILVLTDSKQNHVAVVPWMHSQYTAQALPKYQIYRFDSCPSTKLAQVTKRTHVLYTAGFKKHAGCGYSRLQRLSIGLKQDVLNGCRWTVPEDMYESWRIILSPKWLIRAENRERFDGSATVIQTIRLLRTCSNQCPCTLQNKHTIFLACSSVGRAPDC